VNEGQYWGYRISAVTTLSRAGNPQMEVTWSVTNVLGENGEYEELPQPVEVKQYISLTDAAMPYSIERLNTMGFNGSFEEPGFSDVIDKQGQPLTCKHDTYQGKTRDRWDLAMQIEAEKAPQNLCKQLSARWKAQNKPKPTKVKPAAAPVTSAAATVPAESETRKKLEEEAPF